MRDIRDYNNIIGNTFNLFIEAVDMVEVVEQVVGLYADQIQ